MRHGWLQIPGIQTGDRSITEQLQAVLPAIAECNGKTVLDLGASEGIISLEFAKAGATRVVGIDCVGDHLAVARKLCAGYPIKFKDRDLNEVNPDRPMPSDIVLCLGIAHKMDRPENLLRYAARSCKELLLLRSGLGSRNGIIRGKHSRVQCDSAKVMRDEGFALEKTVMGPPPHSEAVEYFRRVK